MFRKQHAAREPNYRVIANMRIGADMSRREQEPRFELAALAGRDGPYAVRGCIASGGWSVAGSC